MPIIIAQSVQKKGSAINPSENRSNQSESNGHNPNNDRRIGFAFKRSSARAFFVCLWNVSFYRCTNLPRSSEPLPSASIAVNRSWSESRTTSSHMPVWHSMNLRNSNSVTSPSYDSFVRQSIVPFKSR